MYVYIILYIYMNRVELTALAVTLNEHCTKETCPQMKATDEWMYLCAGVQILHIHKGILYMCVCMYVCVCVCMYVPVRRCADTTYTQGYSHTYYIYVCVCMCVCVCMYGCTCAQVCRYYICIRV